MDGSRPAPWATSGLAANQNQKVPDRVKAESESDHEPETHADTDMANMEDTQSATTDDNAAPRLDPTPEQTASQESSLRKSDQQLIQSTTSLKRPFDLFSGGAEAAGSDLRIRQPGHGVPQFVAPKLPAKPQLGSLHKRRASTSPEKFNTGAFEPLPLRIGTSESTSGGPPSKRARSENKIEISYDSSGTPRITSITPTLALPSGRSIATSELLNRNRPSPSTKPFSVLGALYRHTDLLLLLISYLNIPSLLTLYSISKPFHFIFNGHYIHFILSFMRTWAPNADTIYPWRCFKSLCVRDPSLRKKSSMVGKELTEKYGDLREVPTLRWLQMVVWRQGVCKDMILQLASKGLRCPPGTLDAVKRMWFILDLPMNAQRIALCRTEAYITQRTIYTATLFFMKVDMSFTDPEGPVNPIGTGHTNTGAYPRRLERRGVIGCDLREMLTAERQFTPLWRVLRGWSWDPSEPKVIMNRLDILRLWVRHRYKLPETVPEHVKKQSIMGIPWQEVGTASLERTHVSHINFAGQQTAPINVGLASPSLQRLASQQMLYPHQKRLIMPKEKPRQQLLRPEELMLRESIRRRMGLHLQWTKMLLWGFCDDLGRNLPVRTGEQLLEWSNGKLPMHQFKSDEQVKKEFAAANEKNAEAAIERSNVVPPATTSGDETL
ncbi:hypothetical protein LTR08_007326 [Meristemomyces frigidus]|nr:hypothetical protein LTR08_007326 [Meristemomyces frigidus]